MAGHHLVVGVLLVWAGYVHAVESRCEKAGERVVNEHDFEGSLSTQGASKKGKILASVERHMPGSDRTLLLSKQTDPLAVKPSTAAGLHVLRHITTRPRPRQVPLPAECQ